MNREVPCPVWDRMGPPRVISREGQEPIYYATPEQMLMHHPDAEIEFVLPDDPRYAEMMCSLTDAELAKELRQRDPKSWRRCGAKKRQQLIQEYREQWLRRRSMRWN